MVSIVGYCKLVEILHMELVAEILEHLLLEHRLSLPLNQVPVDWMDLDSCNPMEIGP